MDEGVFTVQSENRASLLKKPIEILAKQKWLHRGAGTFASVLRGTGITTRANS